MSAPICPACGGHACKVIYMGAPMRFCPDPRCATVWGFWSDLPVLFPVEEGGWTFYIYTSWYPVALFKWFFGVA